jgi:putative transposase
MSRYRLYPTPTQEAALLGHCAHARSVWNLAVEQRSWWQPGHPAPGYTEHRASAEFVVVRPLWRACALVAGLQGALEPGSCRHTTLADIHHWIGLVS